jgi:hypothetical protein
LPAGTADAAGGEGEHDVISGRDPPYSLPHRFDDSGAFVAEHCRKRNRVPLVADHDVGLAEAGGHESHQEFPGPRGVEIDLFQGEWFALSDGEGGPDTERHLKNAPFSR